MDNNLNHDNSFDHSNEPSAQQQVHTKQDHAEQDHVEKEQISEKASEVVETVKQNLTETAKEIRNSEVSKKHFRTFFNANLFLNPMQTTRHTLSVLASLLVYGASIILFSFAFTIFKVKALYSGIAGFIKGFNEGYGSDVLSRFVPHDTLGTVIVSSLLIIVLLIILNVVFEAAISGVLFGAQQIVKPKLLSFIEILKLQAAATFIPSCLFFILAIFGIFIPKLASIGLVVYGTSRILLTYVGFTKRLGPAKKEIFWAIYGAILLGMIILSLNALVVNSIFSNVMHNI